MIRVPAAAEKNTRSVAGSNNLKKNK